MPLTGVKSVFIFLFLDQYQRWSVRDLILKKMCRSLDFIKAFGFKRRHLINTQKKSNRLYFQKNSIDMFYLKPVLCSEDLLLLNVQSIKIVSTLVSTPMRLLIKLHISLVKMFFSSRKGIMAAITLCLKYTSSKIRGP